MPRSKRPGPGTAHRWSAETSSGWPAPIRPLRQTKSAVCKRPVVMMSGGDSRRRAGGHSLALCSMPSGSRCPTGGRSRRALREAVRALDAAEGHLAVAAFCGPGASRPRRRPDDPGRMRGAPAAGDRWVPRTRSPAARTPKRSRQQNGRRVTRASLISNRGYSSRLAFTGDVARVQARPGRIAIGFTVDGSRQVPRSGKPRRVARRLQNNGRIAGSQKG